MNDSIQIFLLLVFGPFVVGIAMFLIVGRIKRDWPKLMTGFVGVCSFLVGAFYLIVTGPYMWALHLESKWRAADPQTQSELEAILACYTKSDIAPTQSGWGRDHKLKAGERMTRYSLLGEPLDVVLSADDRIVSIYTSYE